MKSIGVALQFLEPKNHGTQHRWTMVAALENDEIIYESPAIVGCQTPSALAFKKGA